MKAIVIKGWDNSLGDNSPFSKLTDNHTIWLADKGNEMIGGCDRRWRCNEIRLQSDVKQ